MIKKTAIILCLFCLLLLAGCEETSKTREDSGMHAPRASLETAAIDIVREALGDDDPLTRMRAVEVVASQRRADLMHYVNKLTGDEFMPVRFSAAMAIGDLRYFRSHNLVELLLDDPDENVRIAAAYAVTKLGEKGYDKVFRKGLKSDNQTVRANTALVLGKLGEKKWTNLLYEAIHDPDSKDKVVYQAAEALARIGDDKIYPKLWTMLISAYADVRGIGIEAMGALGTQQAKNAIITLLDDDVPEIQLMAAGQLGKLGDMSGEIVVLEFLEEREENLDSTSIERKNILAALAMGQINSPQLKRYLPEFLADNSPMVRLAAAKSALVLPE